MTALTQADLDFFNGRRGSQPPIDKWPELAEINGWRRPRSREVPGAE